MFKNARLKLLMGLTGLERQGAEDIPDATWIIPPHITSNDLAQTLSYIEKFIENPWVDEEAGDAPEDLLRRARHSAEQGAESGPRPDAFIDDDSTDDGLEEFQFPDNIRSKSSNKASQALEELKKRRRKRNRHADEEPDDNAIEARRRARAAAALERRRKIKSGLYIHESDEEIDEEEMKAFFEREEGVRKRQAERVRQALMLSGEGEIDDEFDVAGPGNKGQKRRPTGQGGGSGKRRKTDKAAVGSDGESEGGEGSSNAESASSPGQREDSDEDDVLEETPLSSQSQAAGRDGSPPARKGLQELRQAPAAAAGVGDGASKTQDLEDGADLVEDAVLGAPPPRPRSRHRAGFIIDSSDEEEE